MSTFSTSTRLIASEARAAALGADGLLRHDASGDIERTTLADKLLTLVAAKLVNLVPDAGIWMNTQRPEWNDANNALAGLGVSVVTSAYLARFVEHLAHLVRDTPVRVRPGLHTLLREVTALLEERDPHSPPVDARRRWAAMEQLGRAGERYRDTVHGGEAGTLESVDPAHVERFLATATAWLRRTVSSARRPDGLYHSYSMLGLTAGAVEVQELPLMLEGQVAVVASGLVPADEAAALAEGLRTSALYRADQHSYLLYPDRDLPGFLARNAVDAALVSACPDAAAALADPRQSLLVRDATGGVHFAPGLRNGRVLAERAAEAAVRGVEVDPGGCLRGLYESTFHHRMFTGRSGSFFAYEGLGSIYWHMVSKLSLALLEAGRDARARGVDEAVLDRLATRQREVRAGLGFTKTAYEFGAFPNEAYSHTPRHAGAQQPGMTGQVKEDVVARLAELGVTVEGGRVHLDAAAPVEGEWLRATATLPTVASDGSRGSVDVPADHLAFTLCGVPVVYRRGGTVIAATLADGTTRLSRGSLDADASRALLGRTGAVRAVLLR